MTPRSAPGWNAWLADQERHLAPQLAQTRDALLTHARLQPGERVLDLGAGRGLIALAAGARVGSAGRVVACDVDGESLAWLRRAAEQAALPWLSTIVADAQRLPLATGSFAAVTARSVLQLLPDRPAALREIARVLQPGGRFVCAEPINRYLTPHHHLLDLSPLGELGQQVAAVFDSVYADPAEPMLTFDERDLVQACEAAGLVEVGFTLLVHWEQLRLTQDQARARLTTPGAAGRPSILALLTDHLGAEAAKRYADFFIARASSQRLAERHGFVFLWAREPMSAHADDT